MAETLEEVKTKVVLRVFDYDIHVIFTNDLKKSINKVDNFLGMRPQVVSVSTKAMHIKAGGRPLSFIILPFECDINAIVHESFHAICSLIKWISAEPEEEVVAYHLDYLVGEAVKLYHKRVEPKLEKGLDKGRKK